MSLQSWQETLISALGDGAALGNTTTRTSILPTAARRTLEANFFSIGKVLRVTAKGRISNLVTTPGTLLLDIGLGGVVAASGGAMALNIVAKTNVPFELEWLLTCRAIGGGTSANLMHQGHFRSESVIASPLPSAGGAGTHLLPNAAPAVGTGFDSTAPLILDLFATWSIANASNTITLHQFILEALN
jgi:hypothetical protein